MATKTAVAAPEPEPQGSLVPDRWKYVGPAGRTYTNIPVTPVPDAIVRWHVIPATDGAWVGTDEDETQHPDNWRPEPEPVAPVDDEPTAA